MRVLVLASISFIPPLLQAQLSTGVIEGVLRAPDGHGLAGSSILVTAGNGFRTVVRSSVKGEFEMTLPYGQYCLSGTSASVAVYVLPMQTVQLDLILSNSGALSISQDRARTAGFWNDRTNGQVYPEGLSLAGVLLGREPSSVTEPLDLTGLRNNRLAIESQRGFSWTDTQFKLQGMDVTDSYQPGEPAILPDLEAVGDITVRDAFNQTTSSSFGTEVDLFLSEPRPLGHAQGSVSTYESVHGAFSTSDSGSALSSTNLPQVMNRGLVQQNDRFHWFTRDSVQMAGPVTKWADLFASATGQWSMQTEPLLSAGNDQRSRLSFENARARIRSSITDQFDVLYSGSQIDLSDGGVPAALEAFAGNRLAPSFVLPGGFASQPEHDSFDSFQAGWTHLLPSSAVFELRYSYSTAHLDTSTISGGQSRIDLFGGIVTGAPPLANRAIRPRQEIEAAWRRAVPHSRGIRNQILAGAGWKTSEAENRFTTPSNMNLITASGGGAYVIDFNTPINSREIVRTASGYLSDYIIAGSSLSLEAGFFADLSRGSLPFASDRDPIVWNSISPRTGFSWRVPHSRGVILQAAYFRLQSPPASRYLDFGNPNSLGGSVYQWLTSDPSAPFQTADKGKLLLRFGGPFSSISRSLRRPYADEFHVGATFRPDAQSFASVQLFRRDDKDRIAAINTGVTAQDFTPISILDPGPDGIPGTFDDQRLTVYSQNPSTFGQDRYLLTNPAGLRMLNTGLQAQIGTNWRSLALTASFMAEKSYGPTNPGDAYYENDPGVIGALFLDPNTTIHAAGRIFTDRAYVGKIEATFRLPSALGGIDVASVTDYTDGLVFARQLLVTGLSQGPILVPTTVRGSPEGGDRSQYVINWNLRIGRQFDLPVGRLRISADTLNVTNAAQRLQEQDLSGPSFNLRLPVAIQPPRSIRLGFLYQF